jgi:large subunit ribosomal protein L30
MASSLRIKQVKSAIGGTHAQRETLRSLGLNKIGAESVRTLSNEVAGMIDRVKHLIKVEEVK